jgi:prepilin-type N-terminal cleavage/methylation domain-containing protein
VPAKRKAWHSPRAAAGASSFLGKFLTRDAQTCADANVVPPTKVDRSANCREPPKPQENRPGFTLVEILVVIVILGVLAVVVTFSVRGVNDRGQVSACAGDKRTLEIAADAYMAQESLDQLPALGSSDDRYELFLVDVGMIKQVSTYFDLDANGIATTNGQPCP